MYITPTVFAGGVFLPIHAIAHWPALASMHIGSGPGVTGLSGMQVQPLDPSRRVFIAPSAPAWTMAALPEMESGAAAMALWTGSLWSTAAAFAVASLPSVLSTAAFCESQPAQAKIAPEIRSIATFDCDMNRLLFGWPDNSSFAGLQQLSGPRRT